MNVQLTPADSADGQHQITIGQNGQYDFLPSQLKQGEPLRPDPTHEYVITTLDDNGDLNPTDVYDPPQFELRIWVVAVVTHGLVPESVFTSLSNEALEALTNNNFLDASTTPPLAGRNGECSGG